MKNSVTVNKSVLVTVMSRSDLAFYENNYVMFLFSEHPIKINKNLNFAQFSGADRYILFCGPMFVPALILTLLDPRG